MGLKKINKKEEGGTLEKRLTMENFRSILKMTQKELHFYLMGQLESMYYEKDIYRVDGSFIYAKGDIPVLLLAHMDTVHHVAPTEETIFHDKQKGVLWCPDGIGGDDRCGIFSILDILRQGFRPHVLFCWDEEIGTVGSSFFSLNVENYFGTPVQDALSEINFAVQLDRKGFSEAVYYDLDSPILEGYINSFGCETQIGSYTDICEVCPEFRFAGVNLSAGYMNEHTSVERIYIRELYSTQSKVIEILKDQDSSPQFFDYKSIYPNYGYGPTEEDGGYWDASYDDYYTRDNSGGKRYTFDDGVWNKVDDYDDDETILSDAWGRIKTADDEECQFCGAVKGTVPWDETDSEVKKHLCNDCRVKYDEDVQSKRNYNDTIK